MYAASAFRSVVFPVPVPPDTTTFGPPAHARAEQVGLRSGASCPSPIRSATASGSPGNVPDREERAVERQRWKHCVHPAPVGQADVDHRARVVDPAAARAHHPLDDVSQVLGIAEPDRLRREPAAPLGVDRRRPVRDHLGHGRISHQRLERAEADRVVDDLLDEPVDVGRRQDDAVSGEQLAQPLGHEPAQRTGVALDRHRGQLLADADPVAARHRLEPGHAELRWSASARSAGGPVRTQRARSMRPAS